MRYLALDFSHSPCCTKRQVHAVSLCETADYQRAAAAELSEKFGLIHTLCLVLMLPVCISQNYSR